MPESSVFQYIFWIPDQVRHDEAGAFYEAIKSLCDHRRHRARTPAQGFRPP